MNVLIPLIAFAGLLCSVIGLNKAISNEKRIEYLEDNAQMRNIVREKYGLD